MRKQVINRLQEMMRDDESIYLLFADLGYGVLDSLRQEFPNRAINVGISEQAMVGVASGLALSGKKPIIYSIAPFVSTRVAEQVKLDICQQGAKVGIIATGSGFSYGYLGPTHHCLEDYAIMSCLPGMKVLTPYDNKSAVSCLELNIGETFYLRLLGDSSEELGSVQNDRSDILILGCGDLACKLGHQIASEKNLNFEPITHISDILAIKLRKRIYIIEESWRRGGFGSHVQEYISDNFLDYNSGLKIRFRTFSPRSEFASCAGTREELFEMSGINHKLLFANIT